MHNKENTNLLKDIIRQPYCWPGGYERAAITTDSGVLCHKCLKEEYQNILHSTRGRYNDGWEVAGQLIIEYCEDPVFCDHCSRHLNEED